MKPVLWIQSLVVLVAAWAFVPLVAGANTNVHVVAVANRSDVCAEFTALFEQPGSQGAKAPAGVEVVVGGTSETRTLDAAPGKTVKLEGFGGSTVHLVARPRATSSCGSSLAGHYVGPYVASGPETTVSFDGSKFYP